MTSYEIGFDAGERQAYHDRRVGLHMVCPDNVRPNSYQAGFWDAYVPRSQSWAMCSTRQDTKETEYA